LETFEKQDLRGAEPFFNVFGFVSGKGFDIYVDEFFVELDIGHLVFLDHFLDGSFGFLGS
jgi:hypothetical protein